MTTTRVRAVVNNKEIILSVDVPNHLSKQRATQYLADYLKGQGITSWSHGFATEAAQQDNDALQIFLHSRRSEGADVSPACSLSPRLPSRHKHQKYPHH